MEAPETDDCVREFIGKLPLYLFRFTIDCKIERNDNIFLTKYIAYTLALLHNCINGAKLCRRSIYYGTVTNHDRNVFLWKQQGVISTPAWCCLVCFFIFFTYGIFITKKLMQGEDELQPISYPLNRIGCIHLLLNRTLVTQMSICQ
mgnify:CR=1 FL=1